MLKIWLQFTNLNKVTIQPVEAVFWYYSFTTLTIFLAPSAPVISSR